MCAKGGYMANRKNNKWMLFGGLAAGAAAFYFLDHKRGRERREAFAKKAKYVAETVVRGAEKSSRDGWNHLAGITRQAYGNLGRESPSDRTLVDRIRSRMGRIVLHPHQIH